MSTLGNKTSGWMRDINVCATHLGKVKFLANRGELVDAYALLGTVITDLTALRVTLNTAKVADLVKDLPADPTLDDPILHPAP